MDNWYALLNDEQEAEHDRVCNEGAECLHRDEHIQGTYIPIALKQKIERMKKDHATLIAAAKAEALREAAGMSITIPDVLGYKVQATTVEDLLDRANEIENGGQDD